MSEDLYLSEDRLRQAAEKEDLLVETLYVLVTRDMIAPEQVFLVPFFSLLFNSFEIVSPVKKFNPFPL